MSPTEPTATAEENLVTVATFPEPMEANMARMALESAGIDAVLNSANANSMLPVAFESTLQVRAEDEAAARQVLDDAETHPASVAEVNAAEAEEEKEEVPGESIED